MHAFYRYMLQPWLLFMLLLWGKFAYTRSIIVDSTIWETLFIEIPILVVMIALIESIWQKRPRIRFLIYMLVDTLLSIVFFALIVYYRYFHTLATYTSLFDLNQAGDVSDSIATLIDTHNYVLFADIPIIFLSLLLLRIVRRRQPGLRTYHHLPIRNRYGAALILAAFVLSLLHVLQAIGGGTVNEMAKAKNMGIVTYQAYAVYADAKRKLWPDTRAITPQAIRQKKDIKLVAKPEWQGIAEGKDVYVVQLESFNNFVVGLEIDGREVTPTLNQLVTESIYFDHIYQQIGKGNTSDAEFIMNTSLYPTGTMPMSRYIAGLEVPSLPRFLRPHGYESVTLHTNDASFWNRTEMYEALGFDSYYDKAYFGEEDVLHFGASDEVLYHKSFDVFEEIRARGTRIYANLITMSSHNPFVLPENKRMLKLPGDLEGTFLGNYLESIHYADYALGLWIDEMKQRGLWDDAMVVLYGDHFGVSDSASEEDLRAAAELIGVPYYSKAEMFNVPLIIRVPELEDGIVRHEVGGQIDILPTVMNLLGVRYDDQIIFGQDLLNHQNNLIGQRTYLPGGSFINEEVIFVSGDSIDTSWLLPIVNGPFQEKVPASRYAADYHRALELLGMSDAYMMSLTQQADAVPVVASETEQEGEGA